MAVEIPAIGEDNSTAAPKVNQGLRDFDFSALIAAHRAGALGHLEVATAGNSLAGYGTQNGYGAYVAASRILSYCADIMVHQQGYYENVTAAERGSGVDYPRNPVGQRGLNFAAGGRTIDQMIKVQLPYILEAMNGGFMAPVLLADPWQNDRFGAVGSAQATVTRFQNEFLKPLLDHPRPLLILVAGVAPQNDLGAGTESAFGKHYIEHRMTEYAASEPNVILYPILGLLKSGIPSEEANGLVNWLAGGSDDGIHYNPYSSQILRDAFADDVLRKIARPVPRRVFPAMDFNQTRNAYGNILGIAGLLAGTGGKITDLSKARTASDRTVTSNNMPAGLELIYDTTKGVTITPSLTGIKDRPLALSVSGTPTSTVNWAIRWTYAGAFASQLTVIDGEAWYDNAVNWAGVSVGYGELGLTGDDIILPFPGSGSNGPGHVMPYTQNGKLTFSSMAPFPIANTAGSAGRPLRYDLAGAFLPGSTPTGRLFVGRQGMFKTDRDIWRG